MVIFHCYVSSPEGNSFSFFLGGPGSQIRGVSKNSFNVAKCRGEMHDGSGCRPRTVYHVYRCPLVTIGGPVGLGWLPTGRLWSVHFEVFPRPSLDGQAILNEGVNQSTKWKWKSVWNNWLVVWNFFFTFPIYWESSSQLTNIFQRVWNHQYRFCCHPWATIIQTT